MAFLLQVTFLTVMATLALGCAHQPPAKPAVRLKLAVLPVENDAMPDVASALNDSMQQGRLNGIDDYFVSKVPLEVVQLSIECVQQTPACYTAVGKSLNANRLLLAVIDVSKKRGDKFHVVVTLFDVDQGAPIKVIDRAFRNRKDAVPAIDALVKEALGQGSGGTTGATP
jgi:hypothetical protein